jgi:hypothetical protein
VFVVDEHVVEVAERDAVGDVRLPVVGCPFIDVVCFGV